MTDKKKEHKDHFKQLTMSLAESAMDSSKKLREDLEKYESVEVATDKELRELLTSNRLLTNSVTRLQQYNKDLVQENARLTLRISELETEKKLTIPECE